MNLYFAKYRETTIDDDYIVAESVTEAEAAAAENNSGTIIELKLIAQSIIVA